jgi:murein L,D-transpeptidase YafK
LSSPRKTVAERLEQFGAAVESRLRALFEAAGAGYPPQELAWVAFKDSRMLELYARDARQAWRLIKTYPVLAASGDLGPKLHEGDRQVPEGIYRVESLNPNSRFHLSVRLDYPNDFDRRMAKLDGRTQLGGDIMIHGNSVSIGCLAMGDDAAEEVFVLSALAGREHVKVIISPTDFRTHGKTGPPERPNWVAELYETVREELRQLKKGNQP